VDFKTFMIVFGTVFLAELGDKTQLATLLFASDRASDKLVVFLGAALALVLAAGIATLAGDLLARHVDERALHYVSGAVFIGVGLWVVIKA
jgi:putative Ca2+/H+ antiporter (TMEM165/GDT1 family)